jgi:hypothetical protein
MVCPRELGKMAAAVHGGAAVRIITGEALPATAWRVEVLGSNRDAIQCLCARNEGGR